MKEKLKYLTDILGATDIEIAKRAGLPKETMSRLRSGSRVLKKNSKQIAKLVEGIFAYAEDQSLLDRLRGAIDCSAVDETGIKTALLEWFFDEEAVLKQEIDKLPKKRKTRLKKDVDLLEPKNAEQDMASFGNRLKVLMQLAEISNAQLAEQTGTGEKYISRLRGSVEPPKTDVGMTREITACLMKRIVELGRLEALSDFMGIPVERLAAADGEAFVWNYLCWRGDYSSREAIRAFLEQIRGISHLTGLKLPEAETVLTEAECAREKSVSEQVAYYQGESGLQQAVLRFLADNGKEDQPELWLYSDQSMDWLRGEYALKWFVLMRECLKKGARIRIVHNIARELPEMLNAIGFWMPLYLSGQVEAYYCRKHPGERFSNTLFLGKNACIRGTGYIRDEAGCVYDYHTDKERLAFDQRTFEKLLQDSEPLLSIQHCPTHMSGQYQICNLNDIEICVGRKSVVINKLSEPFRSFVFFHELMIRAFKEYVGEWE
ncbi:MAG: hypothetical protein J6M66_09435 [Lachnospiraceae bacterium]|nr:hypothetical protein [Lachnospiraceae bacterium]